MENQNTQFEFDVYTWGESFEEVRKYIEFNITNVDIHIITVKSGNMYSVSGICELQGLFDLIELNDVTGLVFEVKEGIKHKHMVEVCN